MIFIADVAGQYETLMRLVAKMPREEILFLGDLIDRGPQSREVVEFAMINKCVLGNHEDMAIDYHRGTNIYDEGIWRCNGGDRTLASYKNHLEEDHIKWFEGLPVFHESTHVFASHAPWDSALSLEEASEITRPGRGFLISSKQLAPNSLIWNRHFPCDRRFRDKDGLIAEPFGVKKLQIFGHNSMWGLRRFDREDDTPFALCLDASSSKLLTGLHVDDETGKATIYQEPYQLLAMHRGPRDLMENSVVST